MLCNSCVTIYTELTCFSGCFNLLSVYFLFACSRPLFSFSMKVLVVSCSCTLGTISTVIEMQYRSLERPECTANTQKNDDSIITKMCTVCY